MRKTTAFALLGVKTNEAAARALGIESASIRGWPDELSLAMDDRVIAAVVRNEWRAHILRYGPRAYVPPHIVEVLDAGHWRAVLAPVAEQQPAGRATRGEGT